MILDYLFQYTENINLLLEAGEKGKPTQSQFSVICVITNRIARQCNNLPCFWKMGCKDA